MDLCEFEESLVYKLMEICQKAQSLYTWAHWKLVGHPEYNSSLTNILSLLKNS